MHDVDVARPQARTARDRARAEITREITAAARRQLADVGSAALSLRSVAREVGMVSSAVYRYFPSRDELLTTLIVDAYAAVGAAARDAAATAAVDDLLGRWMAVVGGVRRWALDAPHEFGLIFGTPVPGYRAPADTIDPAAIIPLLLLEILRDATARGGAASWAQRPVPPALSGSIAALRAAIEAGGVRGADGLADAALAQALAAWTQLIGMISFELFGHLHNVIEDHDVYFAHQMRNLAVDLGIVAGADAGVVG